MYLEIIQKVIAGGLKPYRPVPETELTEMPDLSIMLSQCWAELPQDRPTFDEVIRQLKRFNNGK